MSSILHRVVLESSARGDRHILRLLNMTTNVCRRAWQSSCHDTAARSTPTADGVTPASRPTARNENEDLPSYSILTTLLSAILSGRPARALSTPLRETACWKRKIRRCARRYKKKNCLEQESIVHVKISSCTRNSKRGDNNIGNTSTPKKSGKKETSMQQNSNKCVSKDMRGANRPGRESG